MASRPLSTWAAGLSAAFALVAVVISGLSYWNSLVQTRTAREALRISQRAYVGVPDTRIVNLDNHQGIAVYAQIMNSGNTPAYGLEVVQGSGFVTDEKVMFPLKEEPIIHGQTLQPKTSTMGIPVNLTEEQLKKGISERADDKSKFVLAILIKYKDAFGTPHSSEYCYEAANADADGSWHPQGIRTRMKACPTHNCSDGDCVASSQ